MFAKGWMVAKAGPASAIISAMTNATVTMKMMRFINATSLCRAGPVSPAALANGRTLASMGY